MAFYTADWIKKLIAEDHKEVQKHIESKGKDFRSYIDATLPFTLYLDIDNIRKSVLTDNAKFIQDLGTLLQLPDNNLLIKELDTAYKKVINLYIESFVTISSQELENKLNELSLAFEQGGIKASLNKLFKNTVSITEIAKRNKSVLLVFPRFRTISDRFGNDFRSVFNYDAFSDLIDDRLDNSPRNIVKEYLKGNFGVLQNIGHVEVDVISSEDKSSKVKRGLVSPRLLQALVELPKDAKPEALVRKFSIDTKQAETRIIVRKKFTTKLVLEILIESGMMIGSLESQTTNLEKAKLEKAFGLGANLSRRLVEDKNLLLELVTSKSINQHLVDTIVSMIKTGKKIPEYASTSTITKRTNLVSDKVTIVLPNKPNSRGSIPRLKTIKSESGSTVSLLALLNAKLFEQIRKNMGTGNETKVLNFRTGRLAESARVERISQSREGMVSAFYNYMRNPYGTFSEGGKQQYPRSRDPKILISKSIREIGATMVGNRMRAVLV